MTTINLDERYWAREEIEEVFDNLPETLIAKNNLVTINGQSLLIDENDGLTNIEIIGSGGSGSVSYENVLDKPSINGKTIADNINLAQLSIDDIKYYSTIFYDSCTYGNEEDTRWNPSTNTTITKKYNCINITTSGTNSYIDIDTDISPLPELSIDGYYGLDFDIKNNCENTTIFYIEYLTNGNDNSVFVPFSIENNATWKHVKVIYDNKKVRIFIDNIEINNPTTLFGETDGTNILFKFYFTDTNIDIDLKNINYVDYNIENNLLYQLQETIDNLQNEINTKQDILTANVDYYTKTFMDENILPNKANVDNVYTKTEIDTKENTLTTQVNNINNTTLGNGYGTCATLENTTNKIVTLSNYNLNTNGIVSIKFTYNVGADSTININNKGAKAIYHHGSNIVDNIIKGGDVATFHYDGNYYHLLSIDRSFTHTHNTSDIIGLEDVIDARVHNILKAVFVNKIGDVIVEDGELKGLVFEDSDL